MLNVFGRGVGGGNDVGCYLQTKMIDVNDIMRMWQFSKCCQSFEMGKEKSAQRVMCV